MGAMQAGEPFPPGATLADIDEERLLAAIFPSFGRADRDLVGPGDDAAVVSLSSGSVVATTDSMVRGRDWLDAWSTPADVAVKCLTQNLADVAAMGATPTSLLLALVADPAVPVAWVAEFARAMGAEASLHDVTVVGGDLSSAPAGTLAVSVTALGDLQGRDPVCRDGAAPGDVVAVRGSLGRSAAGLYLLQAGTDLTAADELSRDLVASHVAPRGPVGEGVVAADHGATAMIDVSDGLLRDLDRVARASDVVLDLAEKAIDDFAARLAPAVGADVARECVLSGGEEHSLVATYPRVEDVPRGWVVIGSVTDRAGEAGVSVAGIPTAPRGWDHFAR